MTAPRDGLSENALKALAEDEFPDVTWIGSMARELLALRKENAKLRSGEAWDTKEKILEGRIGKAEAERDVARSEEDRLIGERSDLDDTVLDLRAELAVALEALRKHGRHAPGCPADGRPHRLMPKYRCTCGLRAALGEQP